MPSDSKDPEGEEPPSLEVGPEVTTVVTPHGSVLSVKSEGGGCVQDVTLERDEPRGRLPHVTLPPHPCSRESSVCAHDASYEVGSPAMAASSLAVAMDAPTSGTKRKQKDTSCCCACTAPQDSGWVTSLMYLITVGLLAFVLPITEGLHNTWLTEITIAVFLGYLYGVSVLFIVFVEIYLLRRAKRRRVRRRARADVDADDNSQGAKSIDSGGKNNMAYTSSQTLTGMANGKGGGIGEYEDYDTKSVKSEVSTVTELFMGDSDTALDDPLPHRISLFHRVAMAVFALGFMIYLGLLLKQLHEGHSPAACSATSAVWPHYVHLVFLLFQTFFIFKHAQVSLHSYQLLFRLGFLHLVATNWSVAVRAPIRETLEAVLKSNINEQRSNVTLGSLNTSAYSQCYADEDILYKASPYLYPFVLQYSILAIAAAYALYVDVGACAVKEEPEKEVEVVDADRRRRMSYSQPVAVNFHKTHRGLFSGLIIMAATFVSIILFFSYLEEEKEEVDNALSVLIYYSSDIVLQAIIALVVWIGWLHAKRLAFAWPLASVRVDQALILVSMTASLLYRLFRILSTFKLLLDGVIATNTILTFTDLILGVAVNLLQTSFVLDCFSRRSTTRRHLKRKPARGSVTFLLVANLALWVFRMFHFRELQVEGTLVEQAAYGFVVWELVQRVCVPLTIFYHYQVSASLARVWTDAYKKETVKESLRREAGEQMAESMMKSRSMDLQFLPARPSPIMRMIELRRRFRKREDPDVEHDTVWSPVSDV